MVSVLSLVICKLTALIPVQRRIPSKPSRRRRLPRFTTSTPFLQRHPLQSARLLLSRPASGSTTAHTRSTSAVTRHNGRDNSGAAALRSSSASGAGTSATTDDTGFGHRAGWHMEQQVECNLHWWCTHTFKSWMKGSRANIATGLLRPRWREVHRAQAHRNQLLIYSGWLLRVRLLPRRCESYVYPAHHQLQRCKYRRPGDELADVG
jgi:hypothetical protein